MTDQFWKKRSSRRTFIGDSSDDEGSFIEDEPKTKSISTQTDINKDYDEDYDEKDFITDFLDKDIIYATQLLEALNLEKEFRLKIIKNKKNLEILKKNIIIVRNKARRAAGNLSDVLIL